MSDYITTKIDGKDTLCKVEPIVVPR